MRAMDQCGKCGTPRAVRAPCRPCANKNNAAYKLRQKAAGKAPWKGRSKAIPQEVKEALGLRGSAKSKVRRRENIRRIKSEYKRRNPHKAVADCAARFAAKLRARPPWADRGAIDALYGIARAYTDAGIPMHVDHIVPLRSKFVSGLHVEANLRIVPASANMLKGNRWWPDMP